MVGFFFLLITSSDLFWLRVGYGKTFDGPFIGLVGTFDFKSCVFSVGGRVSKFIDYLFNILV